MAIFISSDPHFFHDKPFIYEKRGYRDAFQMTYGIMSKYQTLIQPDDDFYLLGDIVMGGMTPEKERFLQGLPGKVHIILGNHDGSQKQEFYKSLPQVIETAYALPLQVHKFRFMLSHYPMITGNHDDKGPTHHTWCLCGHTHTPDKWSDYDKSCYHVDVDAHDGFPVNIETIIEDLRRHYNA